MEHKIKGIIVITSSGVKLLSNPEENEKLNSTLADLPFVENKNKWIAASIEIWMLKILSLTHLGKING